MLCPACGESTEIRELDGVKLDVCAAGCGGVWLDRFELARLDEPHEPIGDALSGLGDGRAVDHEARRRCPRCDEGHVMIRRVFAADLDLEIDECPGCAGIWLDRGELNGVREAGGEAGRQAAARAAYQRLFAKQVEEARAASALEAARKRRLARALFFLCPSWWIPGDQDWGAF